MKKINTYILLVDKLKKISKELFYFFRNYNSKDKELDLKLKKIEILLRNIYEIFYKFNIEDYAKYQFESYLKKNKIINWDNKSLDIKYIHLYRIYKNINSFLSEIFLMNISN